MQWASVPFTTTLTQAEILYGLALLPQGRRGEKMLSAARPSSMRTWRAECDRPLTRRTAGDGNVCDFHDGGIEVVDPWTT